MAFGTFHAREVKTVAGADSHTRILLDQEVPDPRFQHKEHSRSLTPIKRQL